MKKKNNSDKFQVYSKIKNSNSSNFNIDTFINNILSFKNVNGELLMNNKKHKLIYSDFDDIIPFLLYFNRKSEVKQQITLSEKYLIKGFYPLGRYLYSYRMDEYFGGILTYYEQTKDESVQKIIQKQFKHIDKFFSLKYIPSFFDIKTNKHSKSVSSRGYNLIEVILESSVTPENMKNEAIKLLDNLIENNRFFKTRGLFLNKYKYKKSKFKGLYFAMPKALKFIVKPDYFKDSYIGNLKKKLFDNIPISNIQLMKDNSNLIFSIIEAYKLTGNKKYKDTVKRFIETIQSKMYNKKGYVYKSYSKQNNRNALLSQNFTFLDVLSDYYYFIEKDKKILELIIKITKFWLSCKLTSGLIPENLSQKSYIILDCQTDFSIVLKKIAKITKLEEYDKAGNELYNSILKNFYNDKFLYSVLDYNLMPIHKSANIKYNTLFLKSFIAYNTIKDPFDTIFKDR